MACGLGLVRRFRDVVTCPAKLLDGRQTHPYQPVRCRSRAVERTIHLRSWLAAIVNRQALRGALSIVCAVALFTVGLLHGLQHAEAGVPISAMQLVVSADDKPDAPKAL